MATRHRALRNHPDLQRFCIPSVHVLDKKLGVGAYGSVVELEINGTVCAGKKMHDSLIQGEILVSKYVEECKLMSDIRHPNLVQFLGLCFLPHSPLPVIVMERLLTSFDDLLETNPNIPLCLKRSILADVAKGLTYLHSRKPVVIHRDLSATNVLLDSSMHAKISDLGNARIIDFCSTQRMSSIPGAAVYMPPEAISENCQYGPRLDSFSFGHLTLFAVTQVFPGEVLPPTYIDPENHKHVLGRTEIERREKYIRLLHRQLDEQHPLTQLVKQCLNNEPSERPSSKDILRQLESMKVQIESPYEDLTKLEMMNMLEDTGAKAQQLQKQKCDESCRYRKERDQARQQTEELQTNLQEYETRMYRYREERDQARQQLQTNLQEHETRMYRYREECDQARQQTEKLQTNLQEHETRMYRYREERDQARASARALEVQVNTLSGTNQFETMFAFVKTRRGVVQMLIQKPTVPLNYGYKPRVIVKRNDGSYETGRLMYTGNLSGEEMAGVQLDCHRGQTPGNKCDGTYKDGIQYFDCFPGHALYLLVSMLYIEAGSMMCPLCQTPIDSVDDLQLHYVTSCTVYAGGRSNIPAVLPQPTVSTQQTVQPGGLFGSAQQQSLQPTQVKLHATGAPEYGPSNSTLSLGVSEQIQSAFRSMSLSFSPNSGREQERMGGADQLAAPKRKNSGSQLQSMCSSGNSSLGLGLVGTQAANSSTVFNFNTGRGTTLDFSAGVGRESGNTFLFTAGSNLDSGNVSGRVILKPRRRKS